MQVRLLKEIIGSIAGPSAIGLVDLLYGKKNVNEFIIAKKMKLNINQTRNMLYKLADEGLVSFTRKKDRKNGGWYTYYWTLDTTKSLANLRTIIENDISSLQSQLGTRKNERFYHCSNCDLEMNEENALLNNFTCPECGEVFVLRDNSEFVKRFESAIEKRKEQLAVVEQELGLLYKKEDSVRQRRFKAEAQKKKTERALRRKARIATVKPSAKRPKKASSKRASKRRGS
ncbi:MAG: hypothetical protein AABX53_02540 [Nanoarchaeota archaeon]